VAKRLDWLVRRPIAHRGLHDLALGRPENTLGAFAAAVAHDYAIECDLHLSADGVPMVFHDADLGRLTGESGRVGERSATELARLNVLGSDEHIPTLAELLDLVEGRVPLVIEMKSGRGRDAALARATATTLRAYRGPVAAMSFAPRLLAAFRRAAPELPCGLTAEGDWRRAALYLGVVTALGLDFVSYALADLPTLATDLTRRRMGLPLICWTVRSEAERRRADAVSDQITFEGFLA